MTLEPTPGLTFQIRKTEGRLIPNLRGTTTVETTMRIEGMHCDGCADRIRRVLEREPGVREAEVSHPEGRARVKHASQTDVARLTRVVEEAGYDVSLEGDGG